MTESSASSVWRVEYARFMLRAVFQRRRSNGGSWLKTSGTTAVLKLIPIGLDDAVLKLSLHDRTLEEHFVSKLNFSWPEMSCVSDSPVRGSRTVFASYKDSEGHIQKFAVRFLNGSESQSFVNSLKENLKYVMSIGGSSINTTSQVESQSRNKESNPSVRRFEDSVNPNDYHDPLVRVNNARVPNDHPGVCSNLPASLTPTRPDPAESEEVTEKASLESHFSRNIAGSSFQAMLIKLERVISDMGGELTMKLP